MTLLDTYPRWLLEQRDYVNGILLERMSLLFRNPDTVSVVQRCLLAGRKIRSILLLSLLRNSHSNAEAVANIIYAIECAHASSVLVDDILDGDSFRHGYAATQSLWGPGKSALISHVLMSSALRALEPLPTIRTRFLLAYDDACWGEMHDVMAVPGDWILQGSVENVYTKTTALFRFVFEAASLLTQANIDVSLANLGVRFGELYQYANDFFDWQPDLLHERHRHDERWPITMALPLARYIHHFGVKALGDIRQRQLTYNDWHQLLREIWQPCVIADCCSTLNAAALAVRTGITAHIHDTAIQRELHTIAQLATTREFWFHELQAA
jgi:polyprenyl synthetase